ncbi:MAG: hypothetical protein FWD11_12540 [Micrococcales bacterium]|nr:hypothetical protein [Micrococcales bacterium]
MPTAPKVSATTVVTAGTTPATANQGNTTTTPLTAERLGCCHVVDLAPTHTKVRS